MIHENTLQELFPRTRLGSFSKKILILQYAMDDLGHICLLQWFYIVFFFVSTQAVPILKKYSRVMVKTLASHIS